MMVRLSEALHRECPDLKLNIYPIKNNFFGGEVTVTGLITGRDLVEQLADKELGENLHLSCNVLRNEGDLFLCGMTPTELEELLNTPLIFDKNDGGDFLYSLLGIEF